MLREEKKEPKGVKSVVLGRFGMDGMFPVDTVVPTRIFSIMEQLIVSPICSSFE